MVPLKYILQLESPANCVYLLRLELLNTDNEGLLDEINTLSLKNNYDERKNTVNAVEEHGEHSKSTDPIDEELRPIPGECDYLKDIIGISN